MVTRLLDTQFCCSGPDRRDPDRQNPNRRTTPAEAPSGDCLTWGFYSETGGRPLRRC